MTDVLLVRMLGKFSIEKDDKKVDDSSNRMRKVQLLIAYLIYSRKNNVTQENFLTLMHNSKNDEPADPGGRLKAMFYRARTMLNQLYPDAGYELIVRRKGNYAWNNNIPLQLDVEQFEQLCNNASAVEDKIQRLDLYMQALELYRGDFLPKLAMEQWVIPISEYYHRMYLNAVEQTLSLMENIGGYWETAIRLCEDALKIEPYSEPLYQHLMRGRMETGDRAGALRAYEEMAEILFSNFGVMPSDESRSLYRKASNEAGSQTVTMGEVKEQLREQNALGCALFCEYDFFRMLYQVQARAIVRSGDVIHIALFSACGIRGKELPRRSLDRAMDNLKEILISNLRQGDVVSRQSVSQFIVMLPQANYENSCAVCQRLIKSFWRKFPHAPVDIHYSVQPLEPRMPEREMPGE